jgi:hypothetical protein
MEGENVMKTHRRTILVLVALLTLLSQLTLPTLAYADDQPPATPTEAATELPPRTEETPTEIAPTATPAPVTTEEPTLSDVPPASDAPAVEPVSAADSTAESVAPEEPSLAETLELLPTETDVVVLNENGQPLPLVTQEASEIIASGDPVWCPAGQAPTPGANGCSAAYSTLGDLVLGVGSSINANGTIWITSGTTTDASAVNIDGTTFANWANNSLTLQGGWSGTSGDSTIGTNSVFSVPISITNWAATVTINDLTANNPSGNGFTISTTGDVKVKNSHFDNTGSNGMEIDSSGAVDITNSSFDSNLRAGLLVLSSTQITISYSSFSNNIRYSGLDIKNASKVDISNSEMNGNKVWDGITADNITGDIILDHVFASGNANTGLYLVSGGSVKLSNVTTNGNGNAGIYINSGNHATMNTKPVTLTSITSEHNTCAGLHVIGSDAIDVKSGSIQWNTFGFVVDNNTRQFNGDPLIFSNNKVDITGYGAICSSATPGESVINTYTVPAQGEISFTFDCATQHYYPVLLPNGDRVTIFCPVTGKAIIKRLDNTMLLTELPAGYSYASAFSLDIIQGAESVRYIKEGGHVNIAFKVPTMENGVNYAILYWDKDNQTWIPLKDLILDTKGGANHFSLYSDDPREITSGFNIEKTGDSLRAKIITNFPGTFVLAQY